MSRANMAIRQGRHADIHTYMHAYIRMYITCRHGGTAGAGLLPSRSSVQVVYAYMNTYACTHIYTRIYILHTAYTQVR
jgi:hypothetical protein